MDKISFFQKHLLNHVENFFYRWGKLVATHPWKVIFFSALLTALCSLGFLQFKVQYRADHLWIPPTSPFKKNTEWKNENFQKSSRHQNVIFRSENILTPEGMMQILRIHLKMLEFNYNGTSFEDFCLKVPVQSLNLFNDGSKRKYKREVKTDLLKPVLLNSDSLQTSINSSVEQKHDHHSFEDTDYWSQSFTRRLSGKFRRELPISTTVTNANQTDGSEDYDDASYDIWDDYPQYDVRNASEKPPEDLSHALADLPIDEYCDLIKMVEMTCFEHSLLELWSYDSEVISNLTQQDIVDAVNTVQVSPWFLFPRNYTEDLGGITRNSTGHVIKAEAAWVHLLVDIPEDAELVDPGGVGIDLELADHRSLEFEKFLVDVCNEANDLDVGGVEVRPLTASSFNDVTFKSAFVDINIMIAGYAIMFIYTVIMLGRLNWLQVRLYLSGVGIFSCIMGLASALGLMFFLGLEFNQLQNVLPFIAIGIGIDDMFIIMECWYNLMEDSSSASWSLDEKMGRTLQHAGVSITVTSLTDVLAFALGGFTIMPGLQAFCVSAAICIAMIFILQVSWFVAWLTLDQRRIEDSRHGVFPWIIVDRAQEPVCVNAKEICGEMNVIEVPYGKRIMKMYGHLLVEVWFQNIVIFATLGFLGFGFYGSYHMEQPNDPQKMLPTDSYLSAWIEIQMSHFPSYGYYASVMTGPLDWTDLAKIEKMVHQLEEVAQPGPGRIINIIESWWPHFVKFLQEKKNMSWADIRDNEQFHKYLGDFLFDVDNAKHRAFFKFLNNLQCGEPAPPILATQQKLYFGMSSSNPPPSEYIPAKNTLDYIVASANLSTTAFVHAAIYRAWESDAIISVEMWRNLGMALGAVGIVSLVMLGDIRLCVMVMACVMFTLVDLIGTLYFWDVNIDIISCVNVILAAGLSVDYCVHIANAFSISKGCPTSRTQAALTSLGSAVFNGGLTTLLAVIVLPGSKSHFFLTFFKVFCLTVLYGLFHGLVLLPVLLTNLGHEYEEDACIQTGNVVIKEKVKEMLKEEKEQTVMLKEKVKAMKKLEKVKTKAKLEKSEHKEEKEKSEP